MSRKVNVGIIGCGVIAPTHVKSFQSLSDINIKWACDLIAEKAHKLADQFGIENTCTDYMDVINDPEVDCVSVCTDHASHAEIAIEAMDAGKHVLCEKALASTREGMDQMGEADKRNPGVIFSGIFQHRFDPIIRKLRKLLQDGVFGTLLNAGVQMRCLRTNEYYHGDEWRGTWEKEGGSLLINQSIHFIDSLLWIVGGADEVCGAHANITHEGVIETEDCAAAALRLSCGALGTIEATASSHLGWEPTISLHGVAGSIEVRGKEVVKLKFEDAEKQEMVRAELEKCANGEPVQLAGKDYYGTGHPAQIADFVDAVRNERQPFVTGRQARHAVDVVLGIYESHKSGGWVNLPPALSV